MREVADRITRDVEDLDAMRGRAAAVVQDALSTRVTGQTNRDMYLLSIIAGLGAMGAVECWVFRRMTWL